MPTLTLKGIVCNHSSGGSIELYTPIRQNQPGVNTSNPKGQKIWGPNLMQAGQTLQFNSPIATQNPAPIPFVNPIRIMLWDSRFPFPVKTIEINPTDGNSSYTLAYAGGSYTLNCVITADRGVLVH